ncbi:peptide chain release factor N(5)-glutamine methyltransferase [Emcibacter nanhaiensis]|uniref:Release factor glutamine methyltransferase n=1 Tax=Emcibacter nanhaiensis TaxID=1505037 RepID=A0A501PMN4_9PROT|nr:peptide chain release factor N(5)-glutamine methyltransferase [Emcibacter nanhaiensis]TPD61382.1 peptide chain release factor N(5)-glutamine methyltransferase [Emcibacter nanhaiensis]
MTADLPAEKNTVAARLREGRRRLAACGIDTAELDARLLLSHVLGCGPMELYLQQDRQLTAPEAGCFKAVLARREQREPLSQILGEKEFWSLTFRVTKDVLTPRPDSETLIEVALARIPDRAAPLRILDLGTGSGCLLLSLLSELPNASGVGLDISDAALDVARDNAKRLGFADRTDFLISDWTRALDPEEKFDIILSNPPYIGEAEKDSLPPEVRHYEPESALYAGAEGLDDYRKLIDQLPDFLAPGGYILFEIGAGQAAAARALLQARGVSDVEVIQDLAGKDRCVCWRP